ncbi:MAG TPA: PAS domain S-box protein [Methanospirillum sp.]|nr:PAS domain S-box protein [Methanospirillum sp.]
MINQKISVLYVDDEIDLLTIGKLFLERGGNLSVDILPSAKEALKKIATGTYDVVISDYQMPEMDGIQFLQEVRLQCRDLPFILFTGRGREEVVIQAVNHGVDFYLQKGGEPKSQFVELEHKIRQAVRRKEAERSLKESEKRLSDIIDFLPDPTFAIDVSGTVIAWNRALETLTGTSSRDIIGKGRTEYTAAFKHSNRPVLIDLINEPDETILRYYSHIERLESFLTAETDIVHADGSLLHILVKVSRLFDQAGKITGAIESIRDITQLKKAELEIRRSEERYRSVVNDQTEMITRFTPDGVITFTNEAYRQYFAPRIALENPVGKNIRDIMEIPNYEVVESFLDSLTLESPIREMERMVAGRDGNSYWQIWTVRALFDEDGKKTEYQVVGRDITEKKLADQRLQSAYELIAADEEELREKFDELTQSEQLVRESEERLVLAQEIARTGSWEYTIQTNTIWGSAEALAIFGYPPVAGNFLIEDIESCIPEQERVHQVLVDLIREDIPYDIEYAINPADGSKTKYIHSRARSVRDDSGNIIRIMGVIQDITERKRAEEEIAFKNVILKTQQEVAPEGILIVDKKGDILGFNKKFEDMWEIPGPILSTHNDHLALEYIKDSVVEPERFFERVRYLYDHPHEKSFEEITLGNGKIFERFSSPMVGKNGELLGRVWYFTDISERKHAEYELRAAYGQIQASEARLKENYQMLLEHEHALSESENRFKSLFDLAPYACTLIDHQGKHVLANSAYETITGYTIQDIIGKRSDEFDILSSDSLNTITRTLHRQGYVHDEEVIIRAKSGEQRTILFSVITIEYQGEHQFLSTMIDISQRRRIEDTLRKSNEQITGIAETIPGVVFQFYAKDSGETGLYFVSNRVTEILGLLGDLSSFLPKFISGIIPEDQGRFLTSIDDAVHNKSKWQFEGRFVRPDGKRIVFRGMSAPVRLKDELLFSGVILDITAEKETLESLEYEKKISQILLDTSPAFVVAIGNDGKTLMMNPLLLDTLEYTAEEVQGKDYIATFVPERDRAMLTEVFAKIVQDNLITINENRICSKSGKEYLVEWHGRPVKGHWGIHDLFIGVGIDITHRREEEETLKRSEERYRSLVETTGTGYVVLDMEGRVLDANDEYVRLSGRSSITEILGKPVTDWTAPYDLARNAEEVRKCFEAGSVRGLRIDYFHPDGTIQPIEINASILKSESETVILTLCRGI